MVTFPASLKWHLLITDIGFLLYWAATASNLFPASWLFKDYENPVLQAWNWSFAPLDLCASAMGLVGVMIGQKSRDDWRPFALTSLALTFCAGLMALSFWTLRGEFEFAWWTPNLYLTLWPLAYVVSLICPDSKGELSARTV